MSRRQYSSRFFAPGKRADMPTTAMSWVPGAPAVGVVVRGARRVAVSVGGPSTSRFASWAIVGYS